MTRRTMLLSLLALLVVAGSGCRGIHHGMFPSPFRFGCDPQYCDSACGPVCETACGPVCNEPCGPACPPDCGTCGPSGPYCGPLTWVFGLFRCGVWHGCSGCGETYWGGYFDTPPDCCDPCDRCGNWTGGGCAGQGYAVQGETTGAVAPGGCPHCGQTHAAASPAPSAPAPQTVRTGTPHLAPRQAWRPRTPTVRQ